MLKIGSSIYKNTDIAVVRLRIVLFIGKATIIQAFLVGFSLGNGSEELEKNIYINIFDLIYYKLYKIFNILFRTDEKGKKSVKSKDKGTDR